MNPAPPRVAQDEVKTIDLLGMRISAVDRSRALELLHAFIASGRPHHVVTADASAHVIASADPEFLEIVNRASLVTPDSMGIVWASRRLGTPVPERVSGVDLAERLVAESGPQGYGVYFYGAAPGVAERAADRMRARYPGARIVGTADGFRDTPEKQAALLADIRGKAPAVVLVALGIPKQEKWIARHMHELGARVYMGVGGTFDVMSGQVNRAPAWMQRHGLEWVYRFIKNPRKWAKVANLPVFVLRVLRRERLMAC